MTDKTCKVVLANFCGYSHSQAADIQKHIKAGNTNITACVNSSDVPPGASAIKINGQTLPVCSEETMKGVTAFPTWKCTETVETVEPGFKHINTY